MLWLWRNLTKWFKDETIRYANFNCTLSRLSFIFLKSDLYPAFSCFYFALSEINLSSKIFGMFSVYQKYLCANCECGLLSDKPPLKIDVFLENHSELITTCSFNLNNWSLFAKPIYLFCLAHYFFSLFSVFPFFPLKIF